MTYSLSPSRELSEAEFIEGILKNYPLSKFDKKYAQKSAKRQMAHWGKILADYKRRKSLNEVEIKSIPFYQDMISRMKKIFEGLNYCIVIDKDGMELTTIFFRPGEIIFICAWEQIGIDRELELTKSLSKIFDCQYTDSG